MQYIESDGGKTMFLNQLKDSEKELFLSLSAYAVASDGIFELEEMETVARLCYEMMVPNHLPDTDIPLEELLNTINAEATRAEKNIILFEIILLISSDRENEQSDDQFIANVAGKLGITAEKTEKFKSFAARFNRFNDEITSEISN